MSAGVKGAEVEEVGGGSPATLVNGGAMIGDKDGVCVDCGAGAVDERVGPGTEPEPGVGRGAEDAVAEETAPVSSETNERDGLACEEFACCERGLDRGRRRKHVRLERVGLSVRQLVLVVSCV